MANPKNNKLDWTDLFCGGGGSSTGMIQVPDVEVTYAANHEKIAIETHAANHPKTQHDFVDITTRNPRDVPRTTFLWASPECTNHSNAKGKKRVAINQIDLWGNTQIDPEEERSRATMKEVYIFAEHHKYEAIIVENVTEIRHWQYYNDWLEDMQKLGYLYKEVIFNSMFAHPTPQSRDRIYVIFWKDGNKKPDLDIRPLAYCQSCEKDAGSVFTPKGHELPGRVLYKNSYLYRCEHCRQVVDPYYYAAFNIIDWNLPIQRIGDRKRPLAKNTMKRIQAGLEKFKGQHLLIDTSRPKAPGRIFSIEEPMKAQTTKQTHGLVALPIISSYYGRDDANRGIHEALATVPTANRHALVMPNFISTHRGDLIGRGLDEPLTTVVRTVQQSLISPDFLSTYYGNGGNTDLSESAPTMRTRQGAAFIHPDEISWKIEDAGFRMLSAYEIKLAMGFPSDYVILGTIEQQVQQAGDAVTPPVAKLLVERVVASLM